MAPVFQNRLLASLSDTARERLAPALETVDLPFHAPLVEPNAATRFAYFPESGLASVVVSSRSGDQQIEVGHIGFEGMTGGHVLAGMDRTPMRTLMQVAGSGWRVPSEVLCEAAEADRALRDHLLRYAQTFQLQIAHSALANGRHTIPERLARWLLMCHDRLRTDAMPLTHEFLAMMLGVRRSGITNEIHVLEGDHVVRASRGVIEIRDRAKLERLAGETYGAPEAQYEALFGRFRPQRSEKAPSLSGKRIFLVEDDFHLAMDMQRHFAAEGADVLGPVPSVQDALRLLIATPSIDVAVVDVNLRGEMSFPLAEALRKRGVPFVFVSGYEHSRVPDHLADVGFFDKPIEPSALATALRAVA